MASPRYRYTSLASESSFRLFRLQRSPDSLTSLSETIEIELFEASLEHPPKYEAVSYAWGHEEANLTVRCNGLLLHVSPNVHAILRDLQGADSVGVLWIDSICIDQSSIPEKNIQVPRMRTIYQEAEKVWIWLGRGSFETETTFKFLTEVDNMSRRDEELSDTVCDGRRSSYDQFKNTIRRHRGVYDAADTSFIVDVLNIPWFHRTWTVQELVLARQAILLCGSTWLSWQSFITALRSVQIADNKIGWEESNQDAFSNPATFYEDTLCYRTFAKIVQKSHRTPVSTALRLIRPKLSTDPRDKVYGLYGIFDRLQVPNLPQVNYHGTTKHIYTEITLAALHFEQSLDILYEVCLQPLVSELPSWVPDWSNAAFFEPIASHRFRASIASAPSYTASGTQLSLSGILVDELGEVASSTSVCTANFRRGYNASTDHNNPKERHAAVTELIRTSQSWIRLSRCIQVYPTGEHPSEAFCETITQGTHRKLLWAAGSLMDGAFEDWMSITTANFPEQHTNLSTLLQKTQTFPGFQTIVGDYIRLFGCTPNPEDWTEELKIRLLLRVRSFRVSTFQYNVALNSYQRTFFTTKDGYMGIGPRWARPTDSVVLLAGLKVPFIVRKTGENYSLLGPAYIHGVMEGERWNDAQTRDITLV